MGFSGKQVQALRRKLDGRQIRTRETNGRELAYIEGWFAISEANRIFGFDGWSRETLDARCVLARENRGAFIAVYTAKVRITVQAMGRTIIREGHGSAEGRGSSPGEVHDLALKAAETDGTKRALATFGRPFGLELYRQSRTSVQARLPKPQPTVQPTRLSLQKNDASPIPQPSRRAMELEQPSISIPFVPDNPGLEPGKIDKSALALPEPKRRRDKSHLRFVASQPCLVCGRRPSDPHHLRFAQPRALGLKVSDEFTVPVCRTHHRQLHQTGDEVSWWNGVKIDALLAARTLWEQTHPKEVQINTLDLQENHERTDFQ
jgi:hypothetical protein